MKQMLASIDRASDRLQQPGMRWWRPVVGLVLSILLSYLGYSWYTMVDSELPGGHLAGVGGQLVRQALLVDMGTEGASPPGGASAPLLHKGDTVALPHRLEPSAARQVNYRVFLDLPESGADQAPHALCIPRWSSHASVWVDGRVLRRPAPGAAGLLDSSSPAFLSLPPGLTPGHHVLDIGLRVIPGNFPGLSEIWVGPGDVIRQACQSLQSSQQRSSVGNLYTMSFIGMLALVVSLLRRDRTAAYFALLAGAWVAHRLLQTEPWPGMTEQTWIALFHLSRPLIAFPLALFVLSLIGDVPASVSRSVVIFYGLAYLAFALVPAAQWTIWMVSVGLMSLALLAVLLIWLARHTLRSSGVSGIVFGVALFFGIAFNLMDVVRWFGWLPYDGRSMSHLAVSCLTLGMGVLMVERFLTYTRNELRAADHLREEVARQRAQLDKDFQLLQAQNERIAVLEERKRIVRDMHDGLGTQLVSASALLRSDTSTPQPLNDLIDRALSELRSVLDVLSSSSGMHDLFDDDPVTLLLAKLRHRLTPVFRSQGVEIAWEADALPGDFLASDHARLQLLRLLQEAFANVLKHAQASTVSFRTQHRDGCIEMELRDDGRGLRVEAGHGSGHGMESMHVRAQQMGARLTVEDATPGVRVRLVFPWPLPSTPRPESTPGAA